MTNLPRQKTGFTLIELMLAMTFFSSILIVSTLVIIQVMGIYNKGIVTTQINAIGRTLADDIIRIGNGGGSTDGIAVPVSAADGRTRCMKLGNNIYIWSFADDSATDPFTFKTNTANKLVSFAHITDPTITACPDPSTPLQDSSVDVLLSDNARVYVADVRTITDQPNLVNVKFIFGSYSDTIADNKPQYTSPAKTSVACQSTSLGNFCAFGTYETVIYLSNGQ